MFLASTIVPSQNLHSASSRTAWMCNGSFTVLTVEVELIGAGDVRDSWHRVVMGDPLYRNSKTNQHETIAALIEELRRALAPSGRHGMNRRHRALTHREATKNADRVVTAGAATLDFLIAASLGRPSVGARVAAARGRTCGAPRFRGAPACQSGNLGR